MAGLIARPHSTSDPCVAFLVDQLNRVWYFEERMKQRGLTFEDWVIFILDVDDIHGGPLANRLMPGHNWQKIRDLGQTPIARGLADREFIQEVVDSISKRVGDGMRELHETVVVVMTAGKVGVFSVPPMGKA